jgi:putative membrane protein
MLKLLIKLVIRSFAVILSSYVVPGVKVEDFMTAVLVAISLAVMNTLVKPVLVFLTLPINILTFGLFILVINGLLVLVVDSLIPQFTVNSFLSGLLFSIILSIISSILFSLK